MTSAPASSSRSAIRARTKVPWWMNTLRPNLGAGANRHELQSQLVAWVDGWDATGP